MNQIANQPLIGQVVGQVLEPDVPRLGKLSHREAVPATVAGPPSRAMITVWNDTSGLKTWGSM